MQSYFNPTRSNMEDDLNIFSKGRRPKYFQMEDDLNFFQMKDDLIFFQIEDDLNLIQIKLT